MPDHFSATARLQGKRHSNAHLLHFEFMWFKPSNQKFESTVSDFTPNASTGEQKSEEHLAQFYC